MIKKRPVAHIGVAVSEVDKNAQWYQDILGFQIKAKFVGRTGHNVYFLEGANNAIYEMYQDDNLDPAVAGKIDHIAYDSQDIYADYQFCMDAGYDIVTNGVEEIPHFWEKGCKYFKIKSPAGEQVEFCQIL